MNDAYQDFLKHSEIDENEKYADEFAMEIEELASFHQVTCDYYMAEFM